MLVGMLLSIRLHWFATTPVIIPFVVLGSCSAVQTLAVVAAANDLMWCGSAYISYIAVSPAPLPLPLSLSQNSPRTSSDMPGPDLAKFS